MTELESALMLELDMLRAQNRKLLARVRELEEKKGGDAVAISDARRDSSRSEQSPKVIGAADSTSAPAPKPKKRPKVEETYPHVSNPVIGKVAWLVFDRDNHELLAETVASRAYEAWEKSKTSLTFGQCLVVQREEWDRFEQKKRNQKRNGAA